MVSLMGRRDDRICLVIDSFFGPIVNKKKEMASSSSSSSKKRPIDDGLNECPICCTEYTVKNVKVACPYSCVENKGGESCVSCMKKYLLESSELPHCMHCRREWSIDFIEDSIPPATIKELMLHRSVVFMQRDKAYLPDTQVYMENQVLLKKQRELVNELRVKYEQEKFTLENMNIMQRNGGDVSMVEMQESKGVSTTKCPQENCRGFLIRGTCGMCKIRVCMQCMRERVAEHVCDKNDVEAIDFLKKNTRACPECGYRTMRSKGCSTMFCVQCKTGWNWNTGKRLVGVINNPHYFEWQERTTGRVHRTIGDVVCGGIPETVPTYFNDHGGREVPSDLRRKVFQILNAVHHVHNDRIMRQQPQLRDNRDIRIRYLKNEIDDVKYGRLLNGRHRSFVKRQTFFEIHQMFVTAAADIIQRLYKSFRARVFGECMVELDKLREYYNESLKKASERYVDNNGSIFEFLDKTWTFHNGSVSKIDYFSE
jgi:hypothetical protein